MKFQANQTGLIPNFSNQLLVCADDIIWRKHVYEKERTRVILVASN